MSSKSRGVKINILINNNDIIINNNDNDNSRWFIKRITELETQCTVQRAHAHTLYIYTEKQ